MSGLGYSKIETSERMTALAQLEVVTLSHTGKNRRINEDCFLNGRYVPDHFTMSEAGKGKISYQRTMKTKQTTCLAVFDGMDDVSSDGMASWISANELKLETTRLALLPLSYVDALLQRYLNRVNEQIRQAKQTGSELNKAGASFACVCLRGNQAAGYNFGDCRAYLWRHEHLKLMTTESWNNLDKVSSRSEKYLGMPAGDRTLKCDKSDVITLQDQDEFLICSQSLTDFIDDSTIRSCLSSDNLQSALDQLMTLAHAQGCQESITITVARWCEKEELPQINGTDPINNRHRKTPNPRIEHEHQVFKTPGEKKKVKPEAFKLVHIDIWQNIPLWLQIFNLIAILGIILFLIWLFYPNLFG